MALNYVTLTFDELDAGNDPGSGTVTITPTSVVVAAGQAVVSSVPIVRQLSSGIVSVSLLATDNTGTTPAAGFWAYQIALPNATAQLYLVLFANGATQRFDSLIPVVGTTTYGPALGAYLPLAGGVLTGALDPAVTTLTDAATIAVNAALANDFRVTIAASRNMGNPANPVDGQIIVFQVTQGTGGSFTLTWGTAYDFGTAGAPTLSTTAGAIDLVGFKYNAAKGKWLCTGSALGF